MEEKQAPRRRGRAPPLRLAWPGGGDGIGRAATLCTSQSQQSSSTAASSSSVVASAKRASSKRGMKRSSVASTTSSSSLWVDKYAPRNDSSQLCVAPKKVTEVRTWIETALQAQASGLLILVGSPGIGKSTMVRVLAKELQMNVQEWNDSYTSRQYLDRSNHDALLSVDHQSALKSFEQFLKSAGAGYQSLCAQISTAPCAASTSKRRKGAMKKPTATHEGKAIILLEELPNLYNAEAESQFREIMGRHIQQSQVPTILVFSDVSEGKHKPSDLERLIPTEHLYSDATRILQCHPVTKPKMKKCLQAIAKKEGISVPESFWEEIHLQSRGDIRHAIMALQYQKQRKRQNIKQTDENTHSHDRDTKLSTFHALGKLLYAKRQKPVSGSESGESTEKNSSRLCNGESSNPLLEQRQPLEFNPELVMEQSDMGLGGALTFLGYHSPEFFTDSTDLSQAFGDFSDAAAFLDKSMDLQRDHGDSIYPGGYISSLAGRAVANANRQPAPNKFRSFGAPKVFEVMRKRRGNEATMKQLCKRLSVGGLQSLDSNLGSSRSFVTHDLPFMRTIIPHEVNTAVNNLYSFVRQRDESGDLSDGADQAMKIAAQEQRQILAMDDIIDDDSVEDMVPDNGQSDLQTTTSPTSTVHEPVTSVRLDKELTTTTTATATVNEKVASVQPGIIVIDD